MFTLIKPTQAQIQTFLANQKNIPFSYTEVGATRNEPPSGYVVDHNRVQLGSGQATFELAQTAMRRWQMFNFAWLQLCWPDAPLQVGATVAVLTQGLGIWTLNACRVVYLINEAGPLETFGFAYGTLSGHAEQGEERFCLEWRHTDDAVWYDILAFSRPNHLLAKIGYPYVRSLQKRFGRDSKKAMLHAVSQ